MILAQIGTIEFHNNILSRIDSVDNNDYLVAYETDTIPYVQLIVDDSTTATVQLLDDNDNDVGSPLNMTVEDMTTYKRIKYLGTTLSTDLCGIYSLKIINGSNTYYSDKFRWLDDVSEELKINVVSSDVRLGRSYIFNMDSFIFNCYLSHKYLGLLPEIEEESSEKLGVQIVNYGNLINVRNFTVHGTENTFKFLAGLRIFETNGTVTITYNYKTVVANDIIIEKERDMIDTIDINLKFTVINEVLSVVNI